MHTILITPNILFEYQCKRQIYQIAQSNRIETFLPELECSSEHRRQLSAVGITDDVDEAIGYNCMRPL